MFPIQDIDGICKPILHVIIEEALSCPTVEKICIVVQNEEQKSLEIKTSREERKKKKI